MNVLFREYPCDQVSMFNLTLLKIGCPRVAVHESAVHLLHVLYKRFFMDGIVLDREDEKESLYHEDRRILRESLFTGPFCRSQMYLSVNLAALHPDLTMPIFSGYLHSLLILFHSILID